MTDPWREWQRLIRAGTMWSETLSAAQAVVGHRSKTIETALSNPLAADHLELGRMMSEKGAAFGAAGASLTRDYLAMQADIGAQAAALGQMMMGQLPSATAARAIVSRSKRLGTGAVASSIRAMTPVHRTATANAKRLGKKR